MIKTLVPTVIFAVIIFVLAIVALAVGLIITGRAKIRRGTCGRPPQFDNGKKNDESCPLCGVDKDEPCQKSKEKR